MKKCSKCGKLSDSNFCPNCSGEMIEMNPATEIAADEFSKDTVQSVDSGKNSESIEPQDKFLDKKKIKDIIENMKRMLKDKKKRWILVGILMILLVITENV